MASKKQIIVSIAYIAFTNAWTFITIMARVHPRSEAFWVWLPIPWMGLWCYIFGRMDKKREQQKHEDEKLAEGVKKLEAVYHMKTRFKFNFKGDKDGGSIH